MICSTMYSEMIEILIKTLVLCLNIIFTPITIPVIALMGLGVLIVTLLE